MCKTHINIKKLLPLTKKIILQEASVKRIAHISRVRLCVVQRRHDWVQDPRRRVHLVQRSGEVVLLRYTNSFLQGILVVYPPITCIHMRVRRKGKNEDNTRHRKLVCTLS